MVFAGQTVGIKQTDEHIRRVTFIHYDVEYLATKPADWSAGKTVRSKSVTYVFGINCYPCVRNGPWPSGAQGRTAPFAVNLLIY